MGQFASRAFDGDPYIDILRALPDKELVWWVQKALWLAEGATIVEHFRNVYPKIFMHKCGHCNGAGTVTCPHCNGYKVKRAHVQPFRLSEHTSVGRLLAAADTKECEHCGGYCMWDHESDWQEEWGRWQSRLTYYDRTYGEILDEWYEDVINEGRLDEDTHSENEPMPGPDNDSLSASISRDVAKNKQRLKALMRRIDGHPYEHSHMMPAAVVDPAKSIEDNLTVLGYNFFDLPPEMHPEKFPELLLEGPGGVLHQFDKEIQREYLILRNLDAAIQDLPKPALFAPTAGTVPCPACQGQAWASHWTPNFKHLMRAEQPFWARTLARMSPYWSTYSTTEGSPSYSPWMAAQVAQEQHEQDKSQATARRPFWRQWLGEVPSQPPLLTDAQSQAASAQLDASAASTAPGLQARPASDMLMPRVPVWPSARGPGDPLSRDGDEALPEQEVEKQVLQAPGGPLLGKHVLRSRLQAIDLLNPARAAARKLRDQDNRFEADNLSFKAA